MITVSKEFQWAMAHMLDGHVGLCRNLHGHEYKLIVTVTTKKIDQTPGVYDSGMVIDFKQLKEIVNSTIVNKLDHALMLNTSTTDEFESELINLTAKFEKKHVLVAYRPTAENMVVDFAEMLTKNFKGSLIKVVQLRLYETPTSYAEWNKEEV